MQATYKKNWLFRTFIFILCVSILLPVFANINFFSETKQTFALNEDKEYDKTYVLDDLEGATFDGKVFNINDFPRKSTGSLKVIAFTEYCFSYYGGESNQNYGLYIYVYNPQLLNLSQNYGQNKIGIANSFIDKDVSDWRIHPNDYSKFNLEFLSVSEGLDNNGESLYRRFYKFKVVDNDLKLFNQVRKYWEKYDSRRYYVSEVEFLEVDTYTAPATVVATMFEYTGFSAGYYYNNLFPLVAKTEPLEVAELSVQNTFYRTGVSNLGLGHQNQLNSVYFGVDNRFWETYGELQRIKAEWYEYKIKHAVITKNQDFYNKAKSYLGNFVSSYNSNIYYTLAGGRHPYGNDYRYDLAYNVYRQGVKDFPEYVDERINALYYLFSVTDIEFSTNPDPYSKKGTIESNMLYQYIKEYSNTHSGTKLPIKEGNKLSADLFEDTLDSGRLYPKNHIKAGQQRTPGYFSYDFDINEDLIDMPSYNNPTFIDKWKEFGLWGALFGGLGDLDESYKNKPPIYIVTESDMSKGDSDLAKDLMITDVPTFRKYYDDQKKAKKKTVLLHFANTDYYSVEARTGYFSGGIFHYNDVDSYIARQTCFFDFDILTMTFVLDQTVTVIPCVSSPIDILDPLTSPYGNSKPDFPAWLIWLIIIVIVIVLLFVLAYLSPVLPVVVKGVGAVIKLPLKAVKSVTTAFKKDKYKKQQKQNKRKYNRKKRY